MRGIKAGLLMLGKARAVEIIEAITRQLKRVMQPGVHVLRTGLLDRLADAIVSIEYYMETLQAGRSDPWYMLDNAQRACRRSSSSRPRPCPAVPPLDPSVYARTVQIAGAGAAERAPPTWRRSRRPRPTLAASAPKRAPQVHCRPGAGEALHRGGPARRSPRSSSTSRCGTRTRRARRAGDRAPLVPHAQGQRPHGRRARPGRVRLVDREPAEPRARQHAHPLAGDPRDAARGGRPRCRSWWRSSKRRGRPARMLERISCARARAAPAGAPGAATRPRPPRSDRGSEAEAVRPASTADAPPGAAAAPQRAAAHRGRRRRQPPPGEARRSRIDALRDIYARETARARGHRARLPGARGAAARAARPARGCLPRLPYAVGQLEDGRGAPRHPPRRAARSLAAAPFGSGLGLATEDLVAARGLHDGDGVGRRRI